MRAGGQRDGGNSWRHARGRASPENQSARGDDAMTFQPISEVLPDGRRFTSGYVDPLPDQDKKNDSKDWARRIMARMKQGEHLPRVAELAAKEVLGLS